MFEKEAEDSFKCKKVLYKWETDKHSYIDGFEDGAKFVYNKANEWHKADIITSQINKVVLGYIKDYNSKMFCLVKWNGEWWYDARTYNDRVKLLAWKEIVLPKESEMTDDLPKFEE